jgi:hypothetical protein
MTNPNKIIMNNEIIVFDWVFPIFSSINSIIRI